MIISDLSNRLVFGKCPVRISPGAPAILVDIFVVFLSPSGKFRDNSWIRPRPLPSKHPTALLNYYNYYYYYYYYGCTALCWAFAAFSDSWSYTQSIGLIGRGISPLQASTYTQNNTNREWKHKIQTSMTWVGFEPTISAFERAKTVHDLDHAVIVIGASLTNDLKIFTPTLWKEQI
jgi:hypothetical protein